MLPTVYQSGRLPPSLLTAIRRGNLADVAAGYAEWGVPMLPVWPLDADGQCSCGDANCESPGKHPLSRLVEHGVRDTSDDPGAIRQMWAVWPDANIGLTTARGLVAVDIDPRHGGDPTDDYGAPPTLTEVTGGAGQHRFYRVPDDVTPRSRVIAPGVELKGAGAFVVTAPSAMSRATPIGSPSQPRSPSRWPRRSCATRRPPPRICRDSIRPTSPIR